MRRPRILSLWVSLVLLGGASLFAALDEKTATAVDALIRLQGVNLEEKPAIKAAVLRVVEKVRGTPDFLRLVKTFELTNQQPGLLELAVKYPSEEAGVESARLLLAEPHLTTLREGLKVPTNGAPLLRVLGNTTDQRAVPLLVAALSSRPLVPGHPDAAIEGLAQTEPGARALLKEVEEGRLTEPFRPGALARLRQVRWVEVAKAATALAPVDKDLLVVMPPVTELLKWKGNAQRGAKIMARETTGCLSCHQVRGQGVDFGPNLSEIGTKLAREAIFESILEPSAGISFGFEAWQLELKSGDEPYGIIVSETPAEVALKDARGILTRYAKDQIVRREQSKTSIMPTGLEQSMTPQEFVDLVEYLFSLKKQ